MKHIIYIGATDLNTSTSQADPEFKIVAPIIAK